MPHKIGKESNVIALSKKALSKAVTERVRIYYLCVNAVLLGVLLQLTRNAPCGDTLSTLIQEDKTAVLFLISKPAEGFFLQGLRNVDTTELTTFGVQVKIKSSFWLFFRKGAVTQFSPFLPPKMPILR